MRVCLIIPPSPFLLDERVFVQLGIKDSLGTGGTKLYRWYG